MLTCTNYGYLSLTSVPPPGQTDHTPIANALQVGRAAHHPYFLGPGLAHEAWVTGKWEEGGGGGSGGEGGGC